MSIFGRVFKEAWHNLTSYDRHADFDSPYSTGAHVPLPQSRRDARERLTNVAVSAAESRQDVSYFEPSSINSTAYPGASTNPQSPAPYSPGLRSTLSRQNTHESVASPAGEIPMQAFSDGLPPPPPCSFSWKKIDAWLEAHYPELWDQLGEGCTNNDMNALEHQLDCSLPQEVRDSLQIHDGQENGGRPTGVIFGCMLLDCEEIVHEHTNWRTVNEVYLSAPVSVTPATPLKAFGGASSAASSSKQPPPTSSNGQWREELMAQQDSQPPGAIQRVYSHPAWIPLARDWGGNNLAVDLAPGPTGKWGQVILYGRDYNCKYVVARSWSALLATVADDMNSGKAYIVDDESQELKLREFKNQNVEPAYFDILRWRADQKYGRRPPPKQRRRSAQPSVNGGHASPTTGGAQSPYASPTAEVGEPRGRSMQRFAGASPVSSPNRPSYGKSSPLARVTEEGASPIKVHTNGVAMNGHANGELIEVSTPRASVESAKKEANDVLSSIALDDDKENKKAFERNKAVEIDGHRVSGGSTTSTVGSTAIIGDDEGMKTIAL